jgi:long-chain fatty acid transport protein
MRKTTMTAAAVAGVLAGTPAWATNGYLSHGYGPAAKAMAGACVAMVENAMCAATNPASLTELDNRWEIGAALFSPDRGFDAHDNAMSPPYGSINAGHYNSQNDLFLIPHFAYARKLDETTSLGFILGGQGGMNTDYDSAIFANFSSPSYPDDWQATSPTGVNLMQMFMGISYAKKLNDQHSVAVMPILAIQSFEAEGLEPFRSVSLYPDKVTNNGQDWSWGGGARFGWLWQATDQLNFGVSYQTRLWMTEFEDYKGLFAEGGDFDIPPVLDLGFAYDFTPDWTFSFNYQYIWYEDVKALGNAADAVLSAGALGGDDGLGFGWSNPNVYKFGLRWKYSPDLTLRMGYSHADQVVPGSQALFNVLAPAVVQDHYTFGFSKKLSNNNEFLMSFMYAPEKKVYGTNPNTGPQTGNLYMSQWDVEVSWVFKL